MRARGAKHAGTARAFDNCLDLFSNGECARAYTESKREKCGGAWENSGDGCKGSEENLLARELQCQFRENASGSPLVFGVNPSEFKLFRVYI